MKTVKVGKKTVVTIIIVLLLTNVITFISMVAKAQSDEMATNAFFGLVRFALLGSCLYYFYAGNKVAKWLIVIITLINGFNGITGLLALLLFSTNRAFIDIDFLNMAVVIIYVATGVVLIVSRPVNMFMRFQREEHKKESNDYESEN